MKLSQLVQRLEQRWHQGPRAAWGYEVTRRRILHARPLNFQPTGDVEIHVLTSASDWLNLAWTLHSFYHVSNCHYALCIHDDGTMPPAAHEALARQFPFARIIPREEADRVILPWLQNFPRCQMLRRFQVISFKEFDFLHYLEAPRGLLLDSDVLFFAKPEELLRRAEDPAYTKNTFNADIETAFSLPLETLCERSGITVEARYNSGVGLYHRESMPREWLEECLGLEGILNHPWRFEQTIHALCSYRHGAELLPAEYDVYLGPLKAQPVVRHYVGCIRDQMYAEGMPRLAPTLLHSD